LRDRLFLPEISPHVLGLGSIRDAVRLRGPEETISTY
jgi:hypothetical protein